MSAWALVASIGSDVSSEVNVGRESDMVLDSKFVRMVGTSTVTLSVRIVVVVGVISRATWAAWATCSWKIKK